MYSIVKTCIEGNNSYSDFFDCIVGLKEGDVISPVLFSLFLDDLETFLRDDVECGFSLGDILLVKLPFADDMAILGNSPNDLQRRLDLLSIYCDRWGLSVNTEKTKVMVFRKKGGYAQMNNGILAKIFWHFGQDILAVVDKLNYLGTVFNYTGSFRENQETIVGKSHKTLNSLLIDINKYDI